jgi:PAS domain S-box-containing protein
VAKVERERFRAALDAELDCHVFLEAVRVDGKVVDFVYVEANHAATSYLGRSVDDLLGRRMLDLYPGQVASGMFDRYVHVIDSGEPLVIDSLRIDSEVQGRSRYFDFRGVRTSDGISLTWRDVTEAAQAAEALAASEERYQLLAENASDVVFRASPDSVIEWVSPSVVDLLGVRPEQVIGRETIELFAEVDRPVVRSAAQQGEPHQRFSLRARYQRPDGELRWSETVVRPVFGRAGELVAVVGSLRDVDDQVLAEKALAASERQALDLAMRYERARDEALEANLAKTAFLSRMSHELRTPLNAVMGFAQLLAMDPLTDEQRDAVEHISLGGKHLLDLIREILDISRIESGRLALSMESVGVADAVSEALDLVRPQARDAGVELLPFDAAACDAYVWADRQRVIQILLNFLSNAVKYNRPGGTCAVAHDQLSDGMIAVRVTDTGVGIAAESLSRLFRPFDRLGAESSGVEGTGIGLTLSDGLAQLMSGRIEVTTELGAGSTFSLVLPSAVPAAASLTAQVPAPAAAFSGPRSVLYIEDNPANRHLMERIVRLRPQATLTTRDRGRSGLETALSSPPDLVLLDLHLPDGPGDDVLLQLREDPRTALTPVVVVTADASPDVRQRLEGLGATGFLTKPVDVDQVLRWVDDPSGGDRQ